MPALRPDALPDEVGPAREEGRSFPPRLTVCGIEELVAHGGSGVTEVLSILDPEWPDPEVFGGWNRHRRTTLRFHDAIAPEPGIVLPTADDVAAILAFGRAMGAGIAGDDTHLLVHCHFGISRSTAAMAILLADAHAGMAEMEVIDRLGALRAQSWPNSRMIGLADDRLGRGGRLLTAARRLHGRQLAAKPHLAEIMRELGRGAEVDAAIF